MRALGPLPIILRESIDHGFFNYAKSRKIDAAGHADYSECSRANVLYDRITAAARELVDAAGIRGLRWEISDNKRATEIKLDPHIAIRIKRIKPNRGDLTASVNTRRQRFIKSFSRMVPIGQMALPFKGAIRLMGYAHPLWITAAFDLDEVEESVSRIYIGIERRTKFIWKIPVAEPAPAVIATLHSPLADRIMDMRKRRSA